MLKSIPGIEFTFFDERDVVRHRLVQQIVRAYERFESEKENSDDAGAVPGERTERE